MIYRVHGRNNHFEQKIKCVTSVQTDRKIGRLVSKQNISIRKIKSNLGFNVTKHRIHRRIRDYKNIVLQKMYKTTYKTTP